jgi:DNA replication protein DnaC
MSATSELAHLFRALKAPAAARALPKLAERAREEQWSYERFAEVMLSTEVSSRQSHGGESRIKAARFPARKTLEEFDFAFQTSLRRETVLHLGQQALAERLQVVGGLDAPERLHGGAEQCQEGYALQAGHCPV